MGEVEERVLKEIQILLTRRVQRSREIFSELFAFYS